MLLIYFILAFFLTLFLTGLVRIVMQKFRITDNPKQEQRKIHKKKTPLGGGIALFLAFFVTAWFAYESGGLGQDILPKHLVGLFFGGLILMIGGILDDKKRLRARYQIWFPIAAALLVIVVGIGPHEITNPFGGTVDLSAIRIPVEGLGNLILFADIVTFFWLMGMMFTTKFLDGLDGLVTGVVGIGALMIFFLSLQDAWYQPEMSVLAIILVGVCIGFLFWNWHPAKIFLGEGGSLFTGFILGSLAILSGGKIATTLLVVGVPMLDVFRVIIRRLQKRQSIFKGDKEHLHFKLLESGLTQRQSVLLFYTISLLFGMTTLFLQSSEKLIALILLLVLMLLVSMLYSKKESARDL